MEYSMFYLRKSIATNQKGPGQRYFLYTSELYIWCARVRNVLVVSKCWQLTWEVGIVWDAKDALVHVFVHINCSYVIIHKNKWYFIIFLVYQLVAVPFEYLSIVWGDSMKPCLWSICWCWYVMPFLRDDWIHVIVICRVLKNAITILIPGTMPL